MLGIDGAGVSAPTRRGLPGWAGHGLRWAALASLLPPLRCTNRRAPVPPLERFAKVAEVVPQDAQAQLNYGKALLRRDAWRKQFPDTRARSS